MKKLHGLKSSIVSGIAHSVVAYAAIIALAPCSGYWFQPRTPERFKKI